VFVWDGVEPPRLVKPPVASYTFELQRILQSGVRSPFFDIVMATYLVTLLPHEPAAPYLV